MRMKILPYKSRLRRCLLVIGLFLAGCGVEDQNRAEMLAITYPTRKAIPPSGRHQHRDMFIASTVLVDELPLLLKGDDLYAMLHVNRSIYKAYKKDLRIYSVINVEASFPKPCRGGWFYSVQREKVIWIEKRVINYPLTEYVVYDLALLDSSTCCIKRGGLDEHQYQHNRAILISRINKVLALCRDIRNQKIAGELLELFISMSEQTASYIGSHPDARKLINLGVEQCFERCLLKLEIEGGEEGEKSKCYKNVLSIVKIHPELFRRMLLLDSNRQDIELYEKSVHRIKEILDKS